MSANVETAVYSNTPAWHLEGTVLDSNGELGLAVPVALRESGLDWEVEKCSIFGPQGQEIGRRFGVQRTSDGAILGVVGRTWQPVQNHEGFAVIEDFMQGQTAYIEAAGALDEGRKVWVLAHMYEDLQIAGESVARYVLFTNGHDGRTSVTAAMTDVRVVCQNTLDMALIGAGRVVRVRHTNKATERLAEAKKILGLRDLYSEELAKQGEWLVKQEMSDRQFNSFLERLMPVPEEQEGKPADTMINKRRDEVRDLYMRADNLNNVRGTRWGALNAVVEYVDHGVQRQSIEAQLKAQWGMTPTPLKDRAAGILTLNAPKGIRVPV